MPDDLVDNTISAVLIRRERPSKKCLSLISDVQCEAVFLEGIPVSQSSHLLGIADVLMKNVFATSS